LPKQRVPLDACHERAACWQVAGVMRLSVVMLRALVSSTAYSQKPLSTNVNFTVAQKSAKTS
jgi:hypothetical protein